MQVFCRKIFRNGSKPDQLIDFSSKKFSFVEHIGVATDNKKALLEKIFQQSRDEQRPLRYKTAAMLRATYSTLRVFRPQMQIRPLRTA